MSTPQQPWSPGQPGPSGPPSSTGAPPAYGASAPGAPQGYGTPQWYGQQQPGSPQGQPGQQPQPSAGATGELVLDVMKPFGAMGMISPVVTIDGHPAPSSFGRNSFVVPAGVHHVEVAQTYLWTYGRAAGSVSVGASRTTEVYYAGPMLTFGLGGALGTEPQRRPGRGVFVGLMVVVAVVVLLAVLAIVIGNLSA